MEITLPNSEIAQKLSQQQLAIVRLYQRQLIVVGDFLKQFNHFLSRFNLL